MEKVIEILNNQKLNDLKFDNKCIDEFVDKIELDTDLGKAYFDKAEQFFENNNLEKAFDYYKISYKNDFWLAPYMLGYFFEVGLGDCIKSISLALRFYKEAINREDYRGYGQIASLVDAKTSLKLWKTFFSSNFAKEYDYKLKNFAILNLDYRIIFIYDFKYNPKFSKEIQEILDIIKPSLKKDKQILENDIKELINNEYNTPEDIETYNSLLYLLDLICNDEDEIYLTENEDFSQKLDSMLNGIKK